LKFSPSAYDAALVPATSCRKMGKRRKDAGLVRCSYLARRERGFFISFHCEGEALRSVQCRWFFKVLFVISYLVFHLCFCQVLSARCEVLYFVSRQSSFVQPVRLCAHHNSKFNTQTSTLKKPLPRLQAGMTERQEMPLTAKLVNALRLAAFCPIQTFCVPFHVSRLRCKTR